MYKAALFGMTAALAYVLHKGSSTGLQTVGDILTESVTKEYAAAAEMICARNELIKKL